MEKSRKAGSRRQPVVEGEKNPLPTPPHLPLILAYAGDHQGCGWHRIRCPAAGLMRAGLAYIRVADGLMPVQALQAARPDVIVWQHQAEEVQLHYMEEARAALPDCTFVFEIDDHLAAVDEANWHESFIGRPQEMEARTLRAIRCCNRIVTATQGIADWLKGLVADLPNPPVINVLPNYLPEIGAGPDLPIRQRKKGEACRIGWSGGVSHGGDLEVIGDLPRLVGEELARRGWAGPAPQFIAQGMQPPLWTAGSYEFLAGVPPAAYASMLAELNLDLALAPLQDSLFNRCKSALRLEQAGWMGAAVLASPVGEYSGAGSGFEKPVWRFVGAGQAGEGQAWAAAIADWIQLQEASRMHARRQARAWSHQWGLSRHSAEIAAAWGLPGIDATSPGVDATSPDRRKHKRKQGVDWVVCGFAPEDLEFLEQARISHKTSDDPLAGYWLARELRAGFIVARPGTRIEPAAWNRLAVGLRETGGPPQQQRAASVSAWSNDGAMGAGFFEDDKYLQVFEELALKVGGSLADAARAANPAAIRLPFPVAPVAILSPEAVQAVSGWPRGSLPEAMGSWGVIATAAGAGEHRLIPGAWVLARQQQVDWRPEAAAVRGLPFGLIKEATGCPEARAWRRAAELWHAAETHEVPVPLGEFMRVMQVWMAYYYGGLPWKKMQSVARIPVGEGAEKALAAARVCGVKWVRWDWPDCPLSDEAVGMLEEAGEKAGVGLVYSDWMAVLPPGCQPKEAQGVALTPVFLPAKADFWYGLARDWVSPTALFKIEAWDALHLPAPDSRQAVWEAVQRGLGGGQLLTHHLPRPLAVAPEDMDGLGRRKEVIKRLWPEWEVEDLGVTGLLKTRRRVSDPAPTVTVIIPTTGDPWLLRPCLASMERHTEYGGPVRRLLVLSGAGRQQGRADIEGLAEAGARAATAQHPAWSAAEVVEVDGEFNFSAVCNAGAALADGGILVFCNDDVRFPQDGWLKDLVGLAGDPRVAWVQPRIMSQTGIVQCAGVYAGEGVAGELFRDSPGPEIGMGGLAHTTHAVGACTAALVAIAASKFAAIGGFPESLPLNFNDVAAGVEARRAGLVNLLAASSEVIHGHSATRGRGADPEAHLRRIRQDLEVLGKGWNRPDETFPEALQFVVMGHGAVVGGMRMDSLRWWGAGRQAPAVLVLGQDARGVANELKAGARVFLAVVQNSHLHTLNPRIVNQPPISLAAEDGFFDFLGRLGISRIVASPMAGEEIPLPDVIERWNKRLGGATAA